MQYKTIALGLLQEQPGLYEKLRSSKRLLLAMDGYAIDLKASHEAWKDQFSQARPGSDPSQITAEALELAIRDLTERLSSASPTTETEELSLDGGIVEFRGWS